MTVDKDENQVLSDLAEAITDENQVLSDLAEAITELKGRSARLLDLTRGTRFEPDVIRLLQAERRTLEIVIEILRISSENGIRCRWLQVECTFAIRKGYGR